MSREILFRGGHADGKRKTIDEDIAPIKYPGDSLPPQYQWNGPPLDPATLREDTYVFSGKRLEDGTEIWIVANP